MRFFNILRFVYPQLLGIYLGLQVQIFKKVELSSICTDFLEVLPSPSPRGMKLLTFNSFHNMKESIQDYLSHEITWSAKSQTYKKLLWQMLCTYIAV